MMIISKLMTNDHKLIDEYCMPEIIEKKLFIVEKESRESMRYSNKKAGPGNEVVGQMERKQDTLNGKRFRRDFKIWMYTRGN